MGPRSRYLGDEVPAEEFPWQDPIPTGTSNISAADVEKLKSLILSADIGVPELVRTAWSSASTFRGSDLRGGANGGRVRLAPQKDWSANTPEELAIVLDKLEKVRSEYNGARSSGGGDGGGGGNVSLADVIVIGGAAAVDKAVKDAGYDGEKGVVSVSPGRGDATQNATDVEAQAVLEPAADGFRNFYNVTSGAAFRSPGHALIDKASMLRLSVPETVALVGGLRALDANTKGSKHGVFTKRPGQLTNDFFVNLLDMSTVWTKKKAGEGGGEDDVDVYEGRGRKSGALRWTATEVDLVFGSHSELRAVAEVYASKGGQRQLIEDFVAAWTKVMNLDRFDLEA